MPRASSIEMIDQNEQPTAAIRVRTKVELLPGLIGESYAKIGAYLGELGELPANTPFVAYHNMDMADLDVEIGFPVRRALPAKGEIQPGSIPAGKRVTAIHRGPYSEMEPTYRDMMNWIAEKKLNPDGTAYEYYFNGPDLPMEEMLTMVVMPVA